MMPRDSISSRAMRDYRLEVRPVVPRASLVVRARVKAMETALVRVRVI